MRRSRPAVKLPVLAVLAFCAVFQAHVLWGQTPQTYSDTFTVGVYITKLIDKASPKFVQYPVDTTLYITNAGASGTDLCADIYVFAPDAQMLSCCSCAVE